MFFLKHWTNTLLGDIYKCKLTCSHHFCLVVLKHTTRMSRQNTVQMVSVKQFSLCAF